MLFSSAFGMYSHVSLAAVVRRIRKWPSVRGSRVRILPVLFKLCWPSALLPKDTSRFRLTIKESATKRIKTLTVDSKSKCTFPNMVYKMHIITLVDFEFQSLTIDEDKRATRIKAGLRMLIT